MADIPITVTTGSLGFNGRGVTGGPINSSIDSMGSGWGVGLAFTGQSLSLYNTTHNHEITTGAVDALVITGAAPTLAYSWTVPPDKGSLTLTGAAPTALRGTNRTPTTGSLAFSGETPTLAYSWTVAPTTGSLAFSGLTPDRIYGTNRTPTTASLTFSGITPTLAYSWTVFPDKDALSLTGYAPTLAYSWTVKPTTEALALTGIAPSLHTTIAVGTAALAFTGSTPQVSGHIITPSTGSLVLTGQPLPIITEPTTTSIAFTGETIARINVAGSGVSIINPSTTTSVPSNYEQCDYTGFRQLPGSLKMTWNKHAVRKKSWEERHPQDVLQSVPEKPKGSRRPERADRFIEDIGVVSKEDL